MKIAAFTLILFLSVCQTVSGYNVTYDDRSIIIDNQRVFLVSGCVHYPRSTPAMWPDLFAKAKANGLNTIQTYVFWNLHESTKGTYNFTDRADLKQFLDLAKQHDLYVTLRIGPFVASEWDFGGLPVWLNWERNIQFRVYNEAWMREMKAWMQYVVEYVDEYFAKNGGPIILTQIENEYQIGDEKYVQWCGELTEELETGTPWLMCNGESANETINTCNSCDCSSYAHSHVHLHPKQPLMWTELWQKHENWGKAQFARDPRSVAFVVAKWVALGGSHFNYYMWHGGNNYGHYAAASITQFYQDNAHLHSDGTVNEPKYSHLGKLHKLVVEYSQVILEQKSPPGVDLLYWNRYAHKWEKGTEQQSYKFVKMKGKRLSILVNNDDSHQEMAVLFHGHNITMHNKSAVLLDDNDKVLFDSGELPNVSVKYEFVRVTDQLQWKVWLEPRDHRSDNPAPVVASSHPLEQLNLTRDKSDFMWYRRNISTNTSGPLQLTMECPGSNMFIVFVDGKQQGSWSDPSPRAANLTASVDIVLKAGALHSLQILSVSLGIHAGVSATSYARKGIIGSVKLDKQDITEGEWSHQPALIGELMEVFTVGGSSKVEWSGDVTMAMNESGAWFQTTFKADSTKGPVFVNATGLSQGHIYVNGRDIGRYWLISGSCSSSYSCQVHYFPSKCGKPTQDLYHIPPDWLTDGDNLLTVCESQGAPAPLQISVVQKHVL